MPTRSVVKHSYLKSSKTSVAKAKAHVRYLAYRPGKDKENTRAFFSRDKDLIAPNRVLEEIATSKSRGVLIHKLILSPGVNGCDTMQYTRHVLAKLEKSKGYELEYRAVIHDNTDHEHAHVVVFGKDRHGRPVRFTKNDYAYMREQGDRYIDKTIEPSLDIPPPERAPINPAERFINLITGPFRSGGNIFKDMSAPDGTKSKRERHRLILPLKQEEKSLGRAWSNEERLAAWAKQQQKEEKNRERWTKPVEITLATNIVRRYSQNSSKEELQSLKESVEDGFYSDQITPSDIARVDAWIKQWEHWEESCKQIERMTYAKALDVKYIDIEIKPGDFESFSKRSDLEDLRALSTLHERGIVSLDPEEAKALSIWIKERELTEPIIIDLGKDAFPLIYDQTDPIDSLRLLARTAKEVLEPADYKRLWRWIFIKEEELKKQVELNKSIVIETEVGKLEFTRHDHGDHLRALFDAWKNKPDWLTKQMAEEDAERLKTWLKEKDDKDKGMDRPFA